MHVASDLVHLAHLATVLVVERAVVHPKAKALVHGPEHELECELLAAVDGQTARVAVVVHDVEGRVA